jgi:hypothetical protein
MDHVDVRQSPGKTYTVSTGYQRGGKGHQTPFDRAETKLGAGDQPRDFGGWLDLRSPRRHRATLINVHKRSQADSVADGLLLAQSGHQASPLQCPLVTQSGHSRSAFEGEDAFPVVLHADHGPAVLLRLVEQLLRKRAYLGVGKAVGWAIGIFALGVVV